MRSSARFSSQACLLQFGSPGRGEASERLAPLFPGADGYPAEVDQGPRLRVRVVSFSDTSPQPNLPGPRHDAEQGIRSCQGPRAADQS